MEDLQENHIHHVAENILEFINNGKKIEQDCDILSEDSLYQLILESAPNNGLRGLLEIKKILEIDKSSKELLYISRNVPQAIKVGITYGAAEYYLNHLLQYKDNVVIETMNGLRL